MPWWEQGVETSRKMVISYDNLIVRLWLNGAIMPYTDGGYAEQHSNATVPKDDCDANADANDDANDDADANADAKKVVVNREGHMDTLIDSKGLPPIPHPYWVDRLGFQQTDPVTDFRSGGVLSLAMLVHIVEICPNVHARFLPSGDAHMLPFGITCINVTDMVAKFCMFSKSVDRMDALLSQKPFWKMFENPDSLLVLQELSMEILCNVVVEMGRERKLPKDEKDDDSGGGGGGGGFNGQAGQAVTVFDFAEILARTEKRVNDDLLGSGPRTVDELRAFHSRNCTRYMKALDRKEQHAQKMLARSQSGASMGAGTGNDKFAMLASATASVTEATRNIADQGKAYTDNVIGNAGGVAGKAGNVIGNAGEAAGGVFNRLKEFGLRPMTPGNQGNKEEHEVEEVDFAKAPVVTKLSTEDSASATESATEESKSALDEAQDLLDFLGDDDGDLLGDTPAKSADYFTIDDDDFL